MRDGAFLTSYGIVNLHPCRETHWLMYNKDCYFDSYGCSPPKTLLKYLKNKHKKCIYPENQIQKMIVFVLVIVYIYST